MADKPNPVEITYFSDVLCIWAYAAEVRLDELRKNFADKINVVERFSPVFADTSVKIGEGWSDRGGFDGFAKHVQKIADDLDFINVNKNIWSKVRPTTSTQAHLFLKALQGCGLGAQEVNFAHSLRHAFFHEAQDISKMDVLYELAKQSKLPVDEIKNQIDTGNAMASLMSDHKSHYDQQVKGSPTYIMNHGRQILFGNVGYRILEANVQELLNKPDGEHASWC